VYKRQDNAAKEAAKMSQVKYDNGASSFFELRDIQLQAIAAEQQRIETQKQLMLTQIALIKSLGGSWNFGVKN
jgi:multidrug efflux system outer membrane protein